MDLLFVGHIGGEAVDLVGDRFGRRRQLEIDDGDLIDDLVLEERVDDSESEAARAAGDNRVFHLFSLDSAALCFGSGCAAASCLYRKIAVPKLSMRESLACCR